MTGENDSGSGLAPAEQAFFDSRGESAPPAPERASDPPAEAEAAESEGGGEPSVREPRHVPLSELIGERKKRQEIERQLAEQAEKWARADERIRLITEAQQRQPEPEQVPGPDDPIGLIEHTSRELAALKRQQQQQEQARQQATQQQQQVHQLVTTYQARATEFTQENPDFDAARQHLLEKRARHLQIQGYDPSAINQLIWHDEASVVAAALQQGANPAERIYALAEEYGYQPKKPVNKSDLAAAIDAKADIVARSKSLSQAGGQASGGRIDAKALATMSDDDFEAYVTKFGAKGFRRALHS